MKKQTHEMLSRLENAGISQSDAFALRRISMTLHRWHELECGDDTGCIERAQSSYACTQCGHRGYGEQSKTCNCEKCGDVAPIRTIEPDGKPFMTRWDQYTGKRMQWPVADRENGAIKRLSGIMARYPDMSSYIQGDPRGAALYILRAGDIPEGCEVDAYYNRGIAVYS